MDEIDTIEAMAVYYFSLVHNKNILRFSILLCSMQQTQTNIGDIGRYIVYCDFYIVEHKLLWWIGSFWKFLPIFF